MHRVAEPLDWSDPHRLWRLNLKRVIVRNDRELLQQVRRQAIIILSSENVHSVKVGVIRAWFLQDNDILLLLVLFLGKSPRRLCSNL